jgi:hypothetical protein
LRRLSHRDIYDLKLSLVFCTHRRSSSNDIGCREVPRKFAMNACQNSSQERMLSGARLLSQALALSFKCRDSSCRALPLDPPLMVRAVMKSSSQIRGSCCPLNLTTPSLSFIPFWQRCGANQETETLRATQSMTVVPECLQFCLLFETMRVSSRTCGIDSVLSQAMPKLTVYRLHHLSPGCYCWRCCLVPRCLDWRDVSPWRCLMVLLVGALKHPNSFECQILQMPHVVIVVGCIGSDICCCR